MAIQVIMPRLGESVEEGTLTKWLKSVGDEVQEYEPLLEVNTDKVDTEIPSPAAGILMEILVPEGSVVRAGQLLAWIGEAGESLPQQTIGAATAVPKEEIVPLPSPAPETVSAREKGGPAGFISPVVARMAREHHVDLRQVPGSGRGGRITKKDLLSYIERQQKAPEAPKAAPPPAPQPSAFALPGKLVPHTVVRRAIAEHMVRSKHTSPHVSTIMEADMSKVIAHREKNKERFAQDGANLTFTAYFVSASISALKKFPIVNSSWEEEGIRIHEPINIGIAVSLGEEGLIAPVVKNADSLSLLGLARAINELASRARARQLKPDEVQGGTFTITNHGVSGSLFAMPIINQPQCAILGVGAIQKRVVVIQDSIGGDLIAIRPMVYLSLTFDHRILDGAIADNFLAAVVEHLEHWDISA